MIVLTAFFKSRDWALWAYGGAFIIGLITYAKVQYIVTMNQWYNTYYTILDEPKKYGIDAFWATMFDFMKILLPYVALSMLVHYIARMYVLRWREAVTKAYVMQWLTVQVEIEGASQRIQEDIFRFARIVEGLGVDVLKSLLTLIAFTPILWGLSKGIDIPVFGEFEGSLFFCAIGITIIAMLISWFVGAKLPHLEYNNQKVEAKLRKHLVYGEDDKQNFSNVKDIMELFTGIRINYQRLYLHYGYFDLWIVMFSHTLGFTSDILLAPSLFAGTITLGIYMQVGNAFGRVYGSLTLFVNNWTTITELRSIHLRLKEFENNLKKYEV